MTGLPLGSDRLDSAGPLDFHPEANALQVSTHQAEIAAVHAPIDFHVADIAQNLQFEM